MTDFLTELIDRFFEDFPEVSGLILRIGESDGLDVDGGDFRSELILRKASEVRRMLSQLLPIFETHDRSLIFRTWTVGAYSIGDLMWHRRTLARALQGIESPALILSMKYGESDFFRYLPLNPKLLRHVVAQDRGTPDPPGVRGLRRVSLLCRAGLRAIRLWNWPKRENVVGISVWCQTGGWLPFRPVSPFWIRAPSGRRSTPS